jgi:anthranilate phosphoribosyltransferase
MSDEPHPFATFVAILGRGKTKQRHLTLEESREAMGMILRDVARIEQIGAFLMLLRLKEEAPEEMARDLWAAHDMDLVTA